MIDIAEIVKQFVGKESVIELDLENIKLGTEHIKIGLEGKAKLRLVHLQNATPAKPK